MRALALLPLVVAFGCLPKPAEPALLDVQPALIDAQLGGTLSLKGSGLVPQVKLDFDKPGSTAVGAVVVSAFIDNGDAGRVELLDVTWVSDTEVSARLANPAQLGTFDVHLFEPRGRELVLPQALQVVDCTDVDCPIPDGGVVNPNTDGGVVVVCSALNYRDRDFDGFGAGTPINRCGPGYVGIAGDCDDRDPATSPAANEVCNGLDDNCNGTIDEGRCADAGWSSVTDLVDPLHDFLSASSVAPGALWIVGGPKAVVRRGELGGFSDVSGTCPGSMAAVWAEPTGEAEVGGATSGMGRVASQAWAGNSCSAERVVGAPIVAMTGFLDAGVAEYVGVTANGQLYRWAHGGPPMAMSTTNLTSRDTVFDLHGSSPGVLLAVGVTLPANGQGTRRLAVWALQSDGTWNSESLAGIDNPNGTLRGLWVLSASEAVAVGESGVVLRKSDGTWRRIDSNTQADLTAVRAFTSGHFYVSQSDGRVRRYANSNWATVFRNDAGVAFNDITGMNEEDLWAVGVNGVIGRGPH